MNHRNKKIVSVLILMLSLFFPLSTRAITTETVGLIPAHADSNIFGSDIRFMYNLDLGQTKQDGIRVINNRDETTVVKLYPVDATATAEGSYALMLEDDPKKDIGSWIHLAVKEIEIGPKTEKTVPFTVSIPPNADAGDHLGGIILEEINTNDTLSGTGVKVITRVGIRVIETVPGEVKKDFSLTRFDYHYAANAAPSFIKDFLDINKSTVFLVGIKNNGNVKLEPTATLEIKNIFGHTVAYLPDRPLGEVFPRGGENGETEVVWDGLPLLGRYTAKITINPVQQGAQSKSEEIVIWAFPYKIAFILVLVVILLILVRLIKIYFTESKKERYPIYVVKLGDNLADLGEKFSVSWKKLARMNYIGKPYEIKAGEKIFIPVTRKNKELLEEMRGRGELEPSILERSGTLGFKRTRAIIIGIILVLAAGSAGWIWKKKHDATVRQVVQAPPPPEAPKETADKTSSGAFKKSSVSMDIYTLESGDQDSTNRLNKKFNLEGYKINLIGGVINKYASTTVEYSPGKDQQAEMVKNDLGTSQDVKLVEVPNLGTDIIVYNAVDKSDFLATDVYQQ